MKWHGDWSYVWKAFCSDSFPPWGLHESLPGLPAQEGEDQRLCGSSFFSLTTAVLPSTSQFISSLTCHSPEALWAGLYRKGKASGKKEGNWLKEMYRQTWFYCGSRYCASKIMHMIFGGGIGFVFTIDIRGNPVSSKPVNIVFPVAFANFVFLGLILVILTTFQTFSAWFYLLYWSVISSVYVTTVACERLIWWLKFFSNKVFFN